MQSLKGLLSELMPWRIYAIKTEYKPKQKTWDVGNKWKEDQEGYWSRLNVTEDSGGIFSRLNL